jgi:hypothetical protein
MKRVVSAVATAMSLAMVISSTAVAFDGPAIRVSHGDPFVGCLVGGNGTGLSYRSAEVEPWIASNPAQTSNVVGAWQQDRWSDGGAKGQVAGWSFDGGHTWGQTPQPFTECAQPFYTTRVLQYQRTSDPWVSIGPDGTVYSVSLPFDGDSIRNGLGAAVSRDGGRTWIRQRDIDPLIARSDTLNPSDDKESVTADPLHAGWAYAVWDQLHDFFPPCPVAPARAAIMRARDRGHARLAGAASPSPCPGIFTGPTYFSRTRDGGQTWEKPRLIVATGPNEQTIGNAIVINQQTGVLYDFFNFIEANGNNNIEMVFSKDRGTTWSSRQYVQRLFTTEETRLAGCACGVVDPRDAAKALRTGDIIPEAAIDPSSGQLYVIWQDGRPNGFRNDMLFASTSTDGGLAGTWSKPTLVNPPTDKAAFTATISVGEDGRVGVVYYDFTPPLTSPDILLTDTWFTATSGPGLNFGPRTLIGGPYNMEAAPNARGFFVGDYIGLAALIPRPDANLAVELEEFVPLFVMTNCTDNSCRAQGTLDGSPAGPDSTDAFSSA